MENRQVHKYELVKSYLRKFILDNQIARGDKIPSENELAILFNVSRLTARQAITELVHEGVLYRQRGSGTFVNGRTGRIGVLMSYIDSYIFTDIVRGIDHVLQRENMGMLLTSSGNSISREKACLENLISQGIDGLIYEPAKSAKNTANIKLLQSITERGIKIVSINGFLPVIKSGKVLIDDSKGVQILVEKMISFGHKKIAGIFLSDLVQGVRRYKGFCETLDLNGIKDYEKNVLWYQLSDLNSNITKILDGFFERIVEEKVTAVCCYNDILAQKLIEVLYHKGIRVPEQISVTGFDGFALTRLTTMYYVTNPKDLSHKDSFHKDFSNQDNQHRESGLATVIHPSMKVGEESVKMLIALINSEINEDQDKAFIQMVPEFLDGISLGRVIT